jgi:hypothetical protein
MSFRIRNESPDELLPDTQVSAYYAPSELHWAKLLVSTDDDAGNCFRLLDGRTVWLYNIDLDTVDSEHLDDVIIPNPDGLAV